jgi:hypothetical protein
MGPPLLLVGTALLVSQPSDIPGWAVMPRLHRGHELVYRGTYRELTPGKTVEERSYLLESRVFVLDTSPRGLDLAFFTVLRPNPSDAASGRESDAVSVRLERALVDRKGHLHTQTGGSLTVPVEGPPFIECGAFVEAPRRRLGTNDAWQLPEPDRPPVTWRVAGPELLDDFPCLRLEAMQTTPDWDRPGGGRIAWRRRETVWLSTDLGVARRVERIVDRRVPARGDDERALVRYDRQSATQYPGQLYEDRRREISEAESFSAALAPCLSDPGRYGPEVYDGMLARIAQHLERQPPTPYREAILQVKRRIEAARRGETPPSSRP